MSLGLPGRVLIGVEGSSLRTKSPSRLSHQTFFSLSLTRRSTTLILPFSTLPYDTSPTLSKSTTKYLRYLELATSPVQESFIDSFAIETLKLLDFDEQNTIVSMRQ